MPGWVQYQHNQTYFVFFVKQDGISVFNFEGLKFPGRNQPLANPWCGCIKSRNQVLTHGDGVPQAKTTQKEVFGVFQVEILLEIISIVQNQNLVNQFLPSMSKIAIQELKNRTLTQISGMRLFQKISLLKIHEQLMITHYISHE